MIDLICLYCRYHEYNEANPPSPAQLVIYQKIKRHPTPHEIYADILIKQKVASLEDAIEIINLYCDALDKGDCVVEE